MVSGGAKVPGKLCAFFLKNLRRRMVVIPGLCILGLTKIPGITATMFLGCWLIQTYDLGATKYVALTAMPHCIQQLGMDSGDEKWG